MTIYFTDTSSFEWADTTSFEWAKETSLPSPQSVLSGAPIVDALNAFLPSPLDVLSGVPVIGQLSVSTENAPRFTAKSLIFDFTDQWSGDSSDGMGIRSIDFYLFGVKYEIKESQDFYSIASNYDGGSYAPYRAFNNIDLAYDGSAQYHTWRTYTGLSYITNQRLIIEFNSEITFDEIVINNYHDSGADTDWGVKNSKIYWSDVSVANTNYGEDISDYGLIFDGIISQHSAIDEADPENLLLEAPSQDVLTGFPVVSTITAFLYAYPDDIATGVPYVPVLTGYLLHGIENVLSGIPYIDSPESELFIVDPEKYTLLYTLTITGDTDIDIPISSFQCRLRSGEQSYLSVVIPGLDYASVISDRPDGQLVINAIYFNDGVPRKGAEIARVNIDSVRIDEGSINKSITITGYRQEAYNAETHVLANYTYMCLKDGKYRYRFPQPELQLKPGHTVIVNGISFIANVISYYVRVSKGNIETQMEVSE